MNEKKVKKVKSLKDDNQSIVLVEFKGEVVYLTHDDVEYNLQRYFTMREKLAEEKKLRKKHETLQEKWEEYQLLLNLCKDHEKK